MPNASLRKVMLSSICMNIVMYPYVKCVGVCVTTTVFCFSFLDIFHIL